ncbi:MAG: YdcF family protein [Pseudomonadota bacterium]
MRALLVLAGLGVVVFFVTLWAVIVTSSQARQDHLLGKSLQEPVEVVLVLGAGMDPDGIISFSSRRRVYTAVQMLEEGKADYLMFTGAAGPAQARISMGDLMRDLAIAEGADPTRLLAEGQSISTFQNLLFSYPMIEERGFTRIAILTDSFHLPRAAALSGFFGKPDVMLIVSPGLEYEHWAPRYWTYVRETLAWWLNALKVTGWWALETLGVSEAERTALIR